MDINTFFFNYCSLVIGLGVLFGGLGAFVSMLVGYGIGSVLDAFKKVTN